MKHVRNHELKQWGINLAALLVLPGTIIAAPPDLPPDYETLTTGLGIGILYEPCIGNDTDGNLNDVYITEYGDEFEKNGFQSVRLRLGMDAFTLSVTGTYPNQLLTRDFFDGEKGLTRVVDDLLARNNNTMYVLISPKGLENGTLEDQIQMAVWWKQIAEEYKDYTHRLIFNLMNEPLIREGEFLDMTAVEELYQALTDAIRPSNPTRYLVYYQIHDERMEGATRLDDTPFSETGPGATDFNHMALPTNHNGYLLFDVHFLGSEDSEGNGEGKRDERLRHAWEFREATGYPVWSGAWNWGAWDTAWDTNEVAELVQLMKDKGIPGTYLMFNSSNTSIYDGNGNDNDNDGIYNEWTQPEYVPIVTSRNPIFWQKDQVHPITMYAPQHDGTADSRSPDTVVDAEGTKDMQIDEDNRVSYLKFNVCRLPDGEVAYAKLRIKARRESGDTISVHLADHSNWDESDSDANSVSGLDWNSAPSYGAVLDSVLVNVADSEIALDTTLNDGDWLDPQTYSHGSWYELDVSSAVTGPGTYSFALVGANGALTKFYSRDCDGFIGTIGTWKYYPRLEVTVLPSAPVNQVPLFSADPLIKLDGEALAVYDGSIADDASDADGDTLRFGKSTGPSWLSIGQDGSLFGTPGTNDIGSNSWTIEVTDAKGGVDVAELQINVTASTVPQMSDPIPFAVVEDAYVKQASPTTNYGDDTELVIRSLASNFTRMPYLKFNVSGLSDPIASAVLRIYSETLNASVVALSVADNSWTEMGITYDTAPASGASIGSGTAVGNAWFDIDVTDYISGNGTYSIALDELNNVIANLTSREGGNAAVLEIRTWVSSGENTAPVFSNNPITEVAALEDTSYSASLADDASDVDNDPLSFSRISGPSWLNVSGDGTLSGIPSNADVGQNSWLIEVSDGQGGSDSATLEITVVNVNDAPIFNTDPIVAISGLEGSAYSDSIAGEVTDVDVGDIISYSKISGPTWLNVAANGVLSGTPSSGDVGLNSWTIEATDGQGGSDTAVLNISVDSSFSLPAAPSALTATAVNRSRVDLSWADNSDNESGFRIERSERNNGSFSEITTVGSNATSYSDSTVRKGTTYYYRIRATNSDGDSAYSNETSATTPRK